jgi:hypothetical protein
MPELRASTEAGQLHTEAHLARRAGESTTSTLTEDDDQSEADH